MPLDETLQGEIDRMDPVIATMIAETLATGHTKGVSMSDEVTQQDLLILSAIAAKPEVDGLEAANLVATIGANRQVIRLLETMKETLGGSQNNS